MARKLSRRETILVAVLGTAAVWAVWTQATKEITPAGGGEAGGSAAAPADLKAPSVRMDLLTTETVAYGGGGRDLFQYAIRPPSEAELRRRREEQERLQRQAEIEAQARAEAAARAAQDAALRAEEVRKNPPKPPPPPINLRYLGYFGRKEDKIAAFEDGEQVLVAKKGEIVKGQFVVVEVRYESVLMGYTNPQFRNETRELAMAPAPAR
jgi:hypothetical protein